MANLSPQIATLIAEINSYQAQGLIIHVSHRLVLLAKLCIEIGNVDSFNHIPENEDTELFRIVAQVMLEKLAAISSDESRFPEIFQLIEQAENKENMDNFTHIEREFLSTWFAVKNL